MKPSMRKISPGSMRDAPARIGGSASFSDRATDVRPRSSDTSIIILSSPSHVVGALSARFLRIRRCKCHSLGHSSGAQSPRDPTRPIEYLTTELNFARQTRYTAPMYLLF